MPSRLHVSRIESVVEHPHLVPGVVHVVLALNVVPSCFENVRQTATDDCATGVSNVKRSCRVYAYKFDLNALPSANIDRSIVFTG